MRFKNVIKTSFSMKKKLKILRVQKFCNVFLAQKPKHQNFIGKRLKTFS